MIRTVLMDFDGTLHDWDSALIRSLDGIMGLSGKEFYDIYIYDIHRSVVHAHYPERHDDIPFHCELILKHLHIPFDPEVVNLICRVFDEADEQARKSPIYFPDAIPALEKIKEIGLSIYLSTGKAAKEKAETIEKRTGNRYFEDTFSETSIGYLKTEPEYYRIALELTGSPPEATFSIGDTPMSDIHPAKAVGIWTIWVNRRGEEIPDYFKPGPDYEVHDLIEAVDILEKNSIDLPNEKPSSMSSNF